MVLTERLGGRWVKHKLQWRVLKQKHLHTAVLNKEHSSLLGMVLKLPFIGTARFDQLIVELAASYVLHCKWCVHTEGPIPSPIFGPFTDSSYFVSLNFFTQDQGPNIFLSPTLLRQKTVFSTLSINIFHKYRQLSAKCSLINNNLHFAFIFS